MNQTKSSNLELRVASRTVEDAAKHMIQSLGALDLAHSDRGCRDALAALRYLRVALQRVEQLIQAVPRRPSRTVRDIAIPDTPRVRKKRKHAKKARYATKVHTESTWAGPTERAQGQTRKIGSHRSNR